MPENRERLTNWWETLPAKQKVRACLKVRINRQDLPVARREMRTEVIARFDQALTALVSFIQMNPDFFPDVDWLRVRSLGEIGVLVGSFRPAELTRLNNSGLVADIDPYGGPDSKIDLITPVRR